MSKHYEFELDENKNYYFVMGGRGDGKTFRFLNMLAQELCKKYEFGKYCINEFSVFFSIELLKYKGWCNFNCDITIMKTEFEKHTTEEIKNMCDVLVRNEVNMYENGR